MSNPVGSKPPSGDPEVEGHKATVEHAYDIDEKARAADYRADAIEAENTEYKMGVLEAAKAYTMASLWAFAMSCTIIMESYCVFLMGNFIALPAFAAQFGVLNEATGKMIIETKWQSALQVGGPLGAIIGVCFAGPLTSRIGYRWATISGLMALNAFIFVFYFANSLPVILASQLLEGIPEIVPMRLRAPTTQMLQMFWAIGAIIVGAVTYRYNTLDSETAFRVLIALQWTFPTPLAILIWIAPKSPSWLVRRGSLEDAERSVQRLECKSVAVNLKELVAMMRRTIELEKTEKEPNHLELFKGTDCYRTLIVCCVYAAQNLTEAGMSTDTAFAMGLITSALQTVMVMLSWILTPYLSRRTIFRHTQYKKLDPETTRRHEEEA
ncbi:Transforming growth factor-beta-induced protein ig-h3 [Verticillium dahliae VDG2]|nr:Transforming growth factor-beta-induced protein ig-h3 [Verticillium dahliae VDG2]